MTTPPNDPQSVEVVPVIQADRDAAADFLDPHRAYEASALIRYGQRDGGPAVQAFARHRIASEDALRKRVGKLEEELRVFVAHGRALGAFADDGPFWVMTDKGYRDVPASDFRRARSALSSPSDGEPA